MSQDKLETQSGQDTKIKQVSSVLIEEEAHFSKKYSRFERSGGKYLSGFSCCCSSSKYSEDPDGVSPLVPHILVKRENTKEGKENSGSTEEMPKNLDFRLNFVKEYEESRNSIKEKESSFLKKNTRRVEVL